MKPVSNKGTLASKSTDYQAAYTRLLSLAEAQQGLSAVREEVFPGGRGDNSVLGDSRQYQKLIKLAKKLYEIRRISKAEYVFFCGYQIDRILDSMVTGGSFDDELEPINNAISAVKKKHGLKSGDYWPRNKGPKEYVRLNNKYDLVLDSHYRGLLKAFGLTDLADLHATSSVEFMRLYERGRRSIFHQDEKVGAIIDVILQFEGHASLSASNGGYLTAVVSLGAAIEGMLLLRCLRSPKKAEKIARSLTNKKKPKQCSQMNSWGFDVLIEVCSVAGWLPNVETEHVVYNTASLARRLKQLRNYIHPGKFAKEKPWYEIDKEEYEDARAIYLLLKSALKVRAV